MQAKRSKKKKKGTGFVNTHARTCTRASPSVSTRRECKQSARADLRSLLLLQLSRRKTSLAVSRPLPLQSCTDTSTHTCPVQTKPLETLA